MEFKCTSCKFSTPNRKAIRDHIKWHKERGDLKYTHKNNMPYRNLSMSDFYEVRD